MKRSLKRLSIPTIAALICGAMSAALAEPPTFDALAADGAQLVENGSFEKTTPGGADVAGWGVPKRERDNFKVVTDEKTAKHGSTFVTFAPEKPTFVYGSMTKCPGGKVMTSFWTRGKGDFRVGVGIAEKEWRRRGPKKTFLYQEFSPLERVNSDEWRRFTQTFEIPTSFEIDGEPVEDFEVQFKIRVKGDMALDACAAWEAGE